MDEARGVGCGAGAGSANSSWNLNWHETHGGRTGRLHNVSSTGPYSYNQQHGPPPSPRKRSTMNRLHSSLWLGLIMAALSLSPGAADAQNVIRAENEKAGTTDWLLTKIIKKGPIPSRYAPENEPYEKGWQRRKQIE